MASSITEEHIKKLREAGYLAANIAHRLPNAGRVVPMPETHERVVFLTHFVRRLGFPLHPFIRGLMFYYGLYFHDLAPTSSSTSQRLSSCARPSSASNLTSACGYESSA